MNKLMMSGDLCFNWWHEERSTQVWVAHMCTKLRGHKGPHQEGVGGVEWPRGEEEP